MVANSVFVNNAVQILPNPYALTIKPRLEYSVFLVSAILEKLQKAQESTRKSNRKFYLENPSSACDDNRFKQDVSLEANLACVVAAVKIIQKRLESISTIGNLTQVASPLISMIRTVNSTIYGDFPQISRDLIELSGLLGSIVMDSGSLAEAKFDFKQTNLESEQILAEVNLIVESKIRTSYPNLNS